jgi:hypothetical protein
MGSIGGAIEAVVARLIQWFKRLIISSSQDHGRSETVMTAACIGSQTLRQARPRTLSPSPAQTGYHTSKAMASTRKTR